MRYSDIIRYYIRCIRWIISADIMKSDVLKSKVVYKGRFVTIRIDSTLINNKIVEREVVESGEGVLIAALTPEDKIILLKQYRPAYGEIYEVPAGAMKKGEEPLQAAQRELLEETGIEAESWKQISQHSQSVHGTGFNYIYIARNLTYHHSKILDIDEIIGQYGAYTFEQAGKFIEEGKIPDLRNRSCIWLTELILLKQKSNI